MIGILNTKYRQEVNELDISIDTAARSYNFSISTTNEKQVLAFCGTLGLYNTNLMVGIICIVDEEQDEYTNERVLVLTNAKDNGKSFRICDYTSID